MTEIVDSKVTLEQECRGAALWHGCCLDGDIAQLEARVTKIATFLAQYGLYERQLLTGLMKQLDVDLFNADEFVTQLRGLADISRLTPEAKYPR